MTNCKVMAIWLEDSIFPDQRESTGGSSQKEYNESEKKRKNQNNGIIKVDVKWNFEREKTNLPHRFGYSHSSVDVPDCFRVAGRIFRCCCRLFWGSLRRYPGCSQSDGPATFGPAYDPRAVGWRELVEESVFASGMQRRADGLADDHILHMAASSPIKVQLLAVEIHRRRRPPRPGRTALIVGGLFGVELKVGIEEIDDGDDEQNNWDRKAINEFGANFLYVELSDGHRRVDQRVVTRKVGANDAVRRSERVVALHIRRIAATFHVGLQSSFVDVQPFASFVGQGKCFVFFILRRFVLFRQDWLDAIVVTGGGRRHAQPVGGGRGRGEDGETLPARFLLTAAVQSALDVFRFF